MQLTIDVKSNAIDKILYFLEHLKDDVTIIRQATGENMDIEIIQEDDLDYGYVLDARERRKNGEKRYAIDEVMKEFE